MEDSEDSVPESPDAGPSYETTPGEATGFDGAEEPRFFNRKRLMIVLSLVFSLVAGGGLILNVNKSKKTETETAAAASAARAPAEFLRNQRDRALAARPEDAGMPEDPPAPAVPEPPGPPAPVPYPYPSATAPAPPPPPPPQAPAAPGRTPQQPDPLRAALRSPLVPGIEGSILGAGQIPSFMQNAAGTGQYLDAGALGRNAAGDYIAQALAARQPLPQLSPVSPASPQDPYAVQNAQDNKQGFYQPGSGGALNNGQFIGDNALWIGTIVPGVLETGINTDLPGDVIARVTQNVYDSRTGKHLLIPQGTLLAARYNSSVSYAQKRVQIAWDTLIRPDGFQIDLGGMNAADRAGYSGQEAEYHENWFEYLKAAGIIALFSVANSKMTEEAAKYSSPETASAVAQANSQFVNQLGGNIVSRAMNIQPSLTVDSGTLINIMLNKTVYLPPLEDYPVSQKYSLK